MDLMLAILSFASSMARFSRKKKPKGPPMMIDKIPFLSFCAAVTIFGKL